VKPIKLNDEQKLAVYHEEGPAVILAGAGSGKTATMTARVREIIRRGVLAQRVCCITFTNKAANELLDRLAFDEHEPHPRVGTIHGLALSMIRRGPKGFGLGDKVTPIDDYDQKVLVGTIIEKLKLPEEYKPWPFLDKTKFHRARGVGFQVDYTPAVHEKALKTYGGYMALTETDLDVWKAYEKAKASQSVVDFDDMIHLVVRRGDEDQDWVQKVQKQFDHIMMDEAQDTNPVQWRMVNNMFRPDNFNAYVVGDLSQCQPGNTLVSVPDQPSHGRIPSTYKQICIKDLQDGDKVIGWANRDQRTYQVGREIKVASRPYQGKMLKITVGNSSTEFTPNHRLYVRFNKEKMVGKYVVYLMYREDLGFRIGVSAYNKKGVGLGPSNRLHNEKGEKLWFLRLADTKIEAEIWEEILSCRFGIPQTMFEPKRANVQMTVEQTQFLFSHFTHMNGYRCLEELGMSYDHPLIDLTNDERRFKQYTYGYFLTAGYNLIPGMMDIPLPGVNRSGLLDSVEARHFEGLVWSLDVAKDHTYVADGIVVGNSIYGFAGAAPEILYQFTENWRGVKPSLYKLERNHRSVPEVVGLANRIQKTMSETVPLKMLSHRGEEGETGTTGLMQSGTQLMLATEMAMSIDRDRRRMNLSDMAILVRSGSQVKDIEPELVKRKIPYIVRGASGFLQSAEVRDILAYLRIAVNPHDYPAFQRSATTPKRGVGDVALEGLRRIADAETEGNLILAARSKGSLLLYCNLIDRLASLKKDPLACLEETIKGSGYEKYLREKVCKKDKDKLEMKMSNLQRLRETFQTITETLELTLDDIVFQLAMNGDKDAEQEGGKVVISTIHSAKGLEWETVYLYNAVEGQLPHKFSQNERELEEERRLFYVACTRARTRLVIGVASCLVTNYSAPTILSPSRFLFDVGILKK
jgi:DNA helicase-2/ATP-dependent DNA helicase PcrA